MYPQRLPKKNVGVSINLKLKLVKVHIGSVTEIQKIFVNILIYSV